MSRLSDRLGFPEDRPARILIAGAHPDDAEIGAAGTIRRLLSERPDAEVTWLVLAAADPARVEEGRASAHRLLGDVTPNVIDIRTFRDGFLPFLGTGPKEAIADHAAADPDLVLAPRRDDAHQDHRFVSEVVQQVFRRGSILEYEVPKWDGDLTTPNVYVPLSTAEAGAKIAHLLESFPSQAQHHWFSQATFRSILHLRGIECRAPDGAAEAFTCRKLVL